MMALILSDEGGGVTVMRHFLFIIGFTLMAF